MVMVEKIFSENGWGWKINESGEIFALQINFYENSRGLHRPTVYLGQEIVSNGRVIQEKRKGYVVKIHKPFSSGLTTDIVEVLFVKNTFYEQETFLLKFKDFTGFKLEAW